MTWSRVLHENRSFLDENINSRHVAEHIVHDYEEEGANSTMKITFYCFQTAKNHEVKLTKKRIIETEFILKKSKFRGWLSRTQVEICFKKNYVLYLQLSSFRKIDLEVTYHRIKTKKHGLSKMSRK